MKSNIIYRCAVLLTAGLYVISFSACTKFVPGPEEKYSDCLTEYELAINSEAPLSQEVRSAMEPSEIPGTYKAVWQSGDKMELYLDKVSDSDGCRYTLENGNSGELASFTGTVGSNEGEKTLYGFCPSSARASGTEDGEHTVSVDLPYVQSPTLESFDPLCDILAAAPMDASFAKGQTVTVDNARFARQMAIVKIIPVDVTTGSVLSDDKVLAVKMTAQENAVLAGRAKLNLESASITGWTSQSASNHVMGVYSPEDCFGVNGSDGALLMVAPGTLDSGSSLKIEASTDTHLLTRSVTLASALSLPAGRMTTLKVRIDDSCVQSSGANLPFTEDFSSITNGDNTSTSGCSSKWDGNDNFPDVKLAYQAGGAVKLGTGSTSGSMTTKSLNLSQSFTVSFKVKGWTSVEGDIVVTAGSQSSTVKYTAKMSDAFESVSLPFYAESSLSKVTFATTAKRCFIDDVSITVRKTKEHAIVLSSESITLPSAAGDQTTFTVSSDYPWTASASEGALFTFAPSSGAEGKTTVTVTSTSANSGYDLRQCGSISISDGTVSESVAISQSGIARPSAGWAELPAPTSGSDLELCKHSKLPSNSKLRNYSFLFDKTKHCSLWVAWPLHSCYIGSSGRSGDFEYDPDFIVNSYEANLCGAYYPKGGSEYSHSRGHQLPSAERTVSTADNKTTFYATNITPQLQSFNGNVWQQLEDWERSKYICSDTLYVVTGPYFDPSKTPTYVYDNKGSGKACQVPTHFWKIYLRTKSGSSGKNVSECSASELKCVGFWFEHKARSGNPTASDLRSVSDIEALTGFTFFPNVPNAPKSSYSASDWGL